MAVSITIFRSTADLTRNSAQCIVNLVSGAIQKRGRATVALSGGTTPKVVYELLATPEFRNCIDWNKTHLFWGDERCVLPNHPESNYRMVKEALLDKVVIHQSNVHRVLTELPAPEAASEYEKNIVEHFGFHNPEFDLVLLGMGEDGHTASLFPGTTALNEQHKTVTGVFVPKLNANRVTLTFPAINQSQAVLFIVSGRGKASVLRDVLEGKSGKYPVERVALTHGDLLWYVDAEAASLLTKKELQ